MAVQQDRRRRKHRRRTLWGTLRMLSRRERSWRTFSVFCYSTTTAVPLALTINMLLLAPMVS